MDRACLWCGGSLKGKRSDALYCDRHCRSAARHAEADANGQLRLQAHGGSSGPLTGARAPGRPQPREQAPTAP